MKQYVVIAALLVGCVTEEDLSEMQDGVTSTNKLAANKLAANKLSANKLAAQKLGQGSFTGNALIETADGRDVLTYITRCALTPSQTITLKDSTGASYTFTGEIGLGSAWTTRALTLSEQRWVSACVLARTNYYGVQVSLSLRGNNSVLATVPNEVLTYSAPEAAFYGNLFVAGQSENACISLQKDLGVGSPSYALRQCAVETATGSKTTMCGFAYRGLCATACGIGVAPYQNCSGTDGTYAEVITVELSNGLLQQTTI
ncbi:MAG: hypothetical protein QM831_00075 [Kofleriaceae bacterium]